MTGTRTARHDNARLDVRKWKSMDGRDCIGRFVPDMGGETDVFGDVFGLVGCSCDVLSFRSFAHTKLTLYHYATPTYSATFSDS
jgi:hypothetical protein